MSAGSRFWWVIERLLGPRPIERIFGGYVASLSAWRRKQREREALDRSYKRMVRAVEQLHPRTPAAPAAVPNRRRGHRTPSGAIVYCKPSLTPRRRPDPLGWLLRFLGFREVDRPRPWWAHSADGTRLPTEMRGGQIRVLPPKRWPPRRP